MQKTYFMIKPEIGAAADHLTRVVLGGLHTTGKSITNLAMRQLDRALVEDFYGEHKERPFFGELCDYIVGGPVVTIGLERENAVLALRELIGATNPEEAAIGTIRDLFGASLSNNAVHASANTEDAARELALIFGK